MNTWVEFVKARLDEDEQKARAASGGPWRYNENKHHRQPGTCLFSEAVFAGPAGPDALCVATTGETDDPQSMRDADHIARYDPPRALRQVEAGRQVVTAFEESDRSLSETPYPDGWNVGRHEGLEIALHALASEWSSHEDYPRK